MTKKHPALGRTQAFCERFGLRVPILLALFLAVFFVFQRMGMALVRRETGSVLAAAVFGAILLAGFCLVIFPVT